jgi:iron(III) transport system substrate-binding protein
MNKKIVARIATKLATGFAIKFAGVAGLGLGLALAFGAQPALAQNFGSPELIAAANKEGRLVYYTANFAEVEQEVIKAFNKRFPTSRSRWYARPAAS